MPATFGWDDVGDFSSLAELLPADVDRPHILGDADLVITEGVVVPGTGRIVALLGVDDLVVVDTPPSGSDHGSKTWRVHTRVAAAKRVSVLAGDWTCCAVLDACPAPRHDREVVACQVLWMRGAHPS